MSISKEGNIRQDDVLLAFLSVRVAEKYPFEGQGANLDVLSI